MILRRAVLLTVLLCFLNEVENAKILGLFEFPSRSHHILGTALLKALAKKGHQVTMLSPYPLKEPLENYEDIFLDGLEEFKEEKLDADVMMNFLNRSIFTSMMQMKGAFYEMSNAFLSHPKLKELLKSNRKFDLVIQDWFMNEHYLGIAHKFNAPVIGIAGSGGNQMASAITGNPAPYSVVPNNMLVLPAEMNFFERLQNTLVSTISLFMFKFMFEPIYEDLYAIHFPNSPPVYELRRNVSLLLLNSHFSLESPRAYLPTMVQVGGFHIEEPKPLSDDLKKFMDEAKEGVLYFSLGSNMKSSQLPKEKLNAIINAFSKLPVKILWKFETNDVPKLPSNVKISKWFPQSDILAHPNTKVFVTHGGLLSTTEAVYHGVPIVGIPFFADQSYNIGDSVVKGYAAEVNFFALTEEKLFNAITDVLTNPRYRENIKKRSQLLRDQPLKPIDNAVYWVEYALRHKGAYHMRSSILSLAWYQYFLLDVIALLVAISALVTFVSIAVIRKFVCFVRGTKKDGLSPNKLPKSKKSKRE